jgi:hypothetical protein
LVFLKELAFKKKILFGPKVATTKICFKMVGSGYFFDFWIHPTLYYAGNVKKSFLLNSPNGQEFTFSPTVTCEQLSGEQTKIGISHLKTPFRDNWCSKSLTVV